MPEADICIDMVAPFNPTKARRATKNELGSPAIIGFTP